MSFDQDAFISYAHIDNQPLPTEKEGWVDLFDQALRQLLSGYAGKKAEVWRDPKLQGNDIFSDEIDGRLAKAAVLVSVLSPRYLKSKACGEEITHFCETAAKNQGIVIGDKCRVFKVIKTPLGKDDSLPDAVAGLIGKMLGYDFYKVDKTNTPIELNPAFGDDLRREFLLGVNRVAWQINNLLGELSRGVPQPPQKLAVYLADCAYDRRDARETLEGELKRLGYTVLPDRELPRGENEYVAEVERLLSRSALAVHFVGGAPGAVPDGATQKSVVMLQNEAAVRVSRERGLRRIISLPAGTSGANPPQQSFIDALHTDAAMQYHAGLITGGIEDLKSAIHAALKDLEKPTAAPKPEEKLVYVMCDPRDQQDTVPLVKALKRRGAHVELTVFTGEAAQVRAANEQLMTNADAIVLFYGAGDDAWSFYQQSEIIKARGQRRDNPPLTYIYVAAPTTPKKELIADTETNVIDGRSGLSEPALKPLIDALKLDDGER